MNDETKFYEKISEDLCGICYESFEDIINTLVYCRKCPNVYHIDCMNKWKIMSATPRKKCPYCSRKTL